MTDKTGSFQLISTKLNRPRSATTLVSRPQLIEQFAASVDQALILVSAPAGYGKTTLVTEWLASHPGPSTWLSLDEHDNDLTVFLAYLVAAIRKLFPGSCTETAGLLQVVSLPALPVIAATVINDLQRIEARFTLVFDDYHAIREPSIHHLIERLLHHPPTSLQLIIITRRDPLLPLSRYRAQAQMAEIRTQQLRFTQEEVGVLLEQVTDDQETSAAIAELETQTEGWITGLRLAILSSLHLQPVAVPLGEAADSRYAMDYMMAEVFARQTPEMQEFLLQTSILDRLSAPLCSAVLGGNGAVDQAQEILESAWRANLFIVSLDRENRWFRYHHLLQQFLQQEARRRYTDEEIRSFHMRAADRLARDVYLEEATRHFLHAGETGRAAQLLSDHRHELMKRGNWSGLQRLLHLLPHSVIDSRPALLLQEAWLQRIQWQAALMQSKLNATDALLLTYPRNDLTRRLLTAEADTLRATVSLQLGDAADAVARLTSALKIIDDQRAYVEGYGRMLLANALQMSGDRNAAIALLTDALNASLGNEQLQLRAWSALALIYYLEADLDGLWLAGTRCNEISHAQGEEDGMLWGQYRLGVVHYLRNELAAAEQAFAACSDRPRPVHTMTTTNTAIGRAMTYQAQGKTDAARAIAEANVTILEEMDHPALVPMAKAFRAELAARQGRMAEALEWIPQAATVSLQQEYVGFYAPQLALPKILLLAHDPDARRRVAPYLDRLRAALEKRHNRRFMIEVLALQALLHEQDERHASADSLLAEALELAGPGRVLRPFVDMGPDLKPVLAHVAARSGHDAFVLEVRSLLEKPATPAPPSPTVAAPPPKPSSDSSMEALTNRELDVLVLLARRMTNKEIAQSLGISAETVKRHASNLYQKLDADNRRQAVIKARALGVLPQ